MTRLTPHQEHLLTIARTIATQVTPGVLMSVGAHDFKPLPSGGLSFRLVLHAFRRPGEREALPTTMLAEVTLNSRDWYDLTVTYQRGGKRHTHDSLEDADFTMLPAYFLSLDYDGPEVRNPRVF